jgi:hypothetical protein
MDNAAHSNSLVLQEIDAEKTIKREQVARGRKFYSTAPMVKTEQTFYKPSAIAGPITFALPDADADC